MTSTETYSFTVNNEDHLSKLPRRIKRPFWYCGIHLCKKTFVLGLQKALSCLEAAAVQRWVHIALGFVKALRKNFQGKFSKAS